MGPRCRLTFAAALALPACCPAESAPAAAPQAPSAPVTAAAPPPPEPATIQERIARDFERAIQAGPDAYIGLFDFTAVGEIEILLHRYDLLGRLHNLPEDIKAQFAGEGAVPYPAERERTNVGKFYKILGQRTVGTGGCSARPPRTEYGKQLATFEPLPASLVDYEPLRQKALAYVAKGGVTGIACTGGKGGIAVVWTERPNARGYDLITIYND